MSRFLLAVLAVMLGAAGLLPGDAWADDPVAYSCPLLNRSYKAHLKQDHLTGAAGELVLLQVGFVTSVEQRTAEAGPPDRCSR